MWMKYRHKWAHGIEKEWHWHELVEPGTLGVTVTEAYAEDAAAEICSEFNWSDKYRGIDYEIVRTPPADVLKDLIMTANIKADYWAKKAKTLKRLLKSLSKKKVRK